ncbi:MAG: hypothetical protein CFH15_00497 [Alphaproteobacteria bacterium MarineAlpha5_Bin5]|mgnify:CR=1 FL=1|nr:MAG: hypothetical protein CFH15_00497 [Alphaproteobacteria bacterium MarineAlpha5_Bin5]PPR50667.1 MAG: hypothetical protein CFH14_00844 [Alphaproteobacteria bacterium MarineAlpha5_Bin4]|tara:strand:+ start:187 stop:1272 length:1086 start_codon:yes stop_codon:yes gene_type:complete
MFVADLHNDLTQRMMLGEDVTKQTSLGHTDIVRLKKSSIDLQVLIIWVSGHDSEIGYFELAKKMYQKLESLSLIDNVEIPKTFEQIIKSFKNKKLSIPLSMEGGEAIENKIENLHYFIEKGLFYFGPTWNNSLDWVSSGYDEAHNKSNIKQIGLNNFGIQVVKECEKNKVLIDVSHIGEKSFWDIHKNTTKPFIASHSSVYNLCPHFRNLKDDQIEAIRDKRGLIGLNPYPFFIDPTFKTREAKIKKELGSELNEIDNKFQNKSDKWIAKQHFLQKKLAPICPDINIYIDHIEYVINKIGIDYVGIGSDYDGLDCLPKSWNDCLDHMIIAEQLEIRGYSNLEIEKIMGKNILRVLEEISFN